MATWTFLANFDGDVTQRQVSLSGWIQLPNFWETGLFTFVRPETMDDRATRGGLRVKMRNYDYVAGAKVVKSTLSFDDFVAVPVPCELEPVAFACGFPHSFPLARAPQLRAKEPRISGRSTRSSPRLPGAG